MDKYELVAQLKEQHVSLRHDLDEAIGLATTASDGSAEKICSILERFKTDLTVHLGLEDGVFYPDYLDKVAKRGADVSGIEEFIRQMGIIAQAVTAFLGKYAAPEAISASYAGFGDELKAVAGTLADRIETEEEGVYDIYLSL